ncbi:MAG: hypothetical protein P8K08_00730 [Fuerstiella sp.]|jgi:hypothetical protein|nr:hypothetical protein [Fuerstiella sp.]
MLRCQFLPYLLLFALCTPAMSQGLRVSTVVYDAGRLNSSGQEPILASSFSLFHNGRAYDYVEAAGEVVIYDSTGKKFTVINIQRGVSTTILFQELQNMLRERDPKIKEYIRELTAKQSPEAERAARMLEFQLKPEFESSFNPATGLLSLQAPSWKYSVSTREWEDVEQLKRYLTYTDWTARLNYLLHPSSMFPEPRLALNARLREQTNRIPVLVQLDLRPDERLMLRAEHQFVRNLTDRDRSLINKWTALVSDGTLRSIPFRSYQEEMLLSLRR